MAVFRLRHDTLSTVSDEREQLRRSWDANAAAWRDAVRERRIASRRVTDAAIVSAVRDRHPARVLDLGCGEGWLARTLSEDGVEVVGVDGSATLIDAANALGGATFRVLSYDDIVNEPASLGQTFDVIVANFSILDDRAETLFRALAQSLATDGSLIVQTLHPAFAGDGVDADGWRTETFARMEGDWREPMPWYFRTIASWLRAFADAGYILREMREPALPDQPPASIIFVCRKA